MSRTQSIVVLNAGGRAEECTRTRTSYCRTTYWLRPPEAVGEVIGCAVLVAVDARRSVALVVGDLLRGCVGGCHNVERVFEGPLQDVGRCDWLPWWRRGS